MSPFQSFSVKSAEILLARLQEISESQVLNQTFIAQTGYGNVELPRKINENPFRKRKKTEQILVALFVVSVETFHILFVQSM